mmetsp:Transcript_66540/g.105268  ORF Transcript_66540/g.105268 Transcript_66540/m.105268 type:complete len:468 (+) Transcript_66540:54-1457(+)
MPMEFCSTPEDSGVDSLRQDSLATADGFWLPYGSAEFAGWSWQPMALVPVYVSDMHYAGAFVSCNEFGAVVYAHADAFQVDSSEEATTENVTESENRYAGTSPAFETPEVDAEKCSCQILQADALDDDTLDVHDGVSFVSSDASTAVAPARHRRSRRAGKAKVVMAEVASRIPILESPGLDEISLTEAMKNELSHDLEAGGDAMIAALSNVRNSVLTFAFEPFGCRLVQLALDVADSSHRQALAKKMIGHVVEAVSSPHANFVIQKLIEVLPMSVVSFVAEELSPYAAEAARHRFACRVLCRLVEHHSSTCTNSTSTLIDELLLDAEKLVHHNFARHVLQLVLDHGSVDHQQRIVRAIRNDLFRNAKSRYASYIVEDALKRCGAAERDMIAADLLSDSDEFVKLAMHESGCHVAKAVIMSSGSFADIARKLLISRASELQSDKYGQRLLEGCLAKHDLLGEARRAYD